MWHSRHTHKARLALRSSLSALRPHPQLPLWSVMGLLRSASSILITGQNPLNGMWFAMKGRGRAVSHWTRLSFLKLHTPSSPRPPFTFPSGGWHVDSALYHPCHSSGMAGCVYMCVCVLGRRCTDRDEEAEQQCRERRCLWLIGARATACSVVLTGSRDRGTTCSAAEIAGTEYRAVLLLFWTNQSLETAYLLSWSREECIEEKFDEVLTSTQSFFAWLCLWGYKYFQSDFVKQQSLMPAIQPCQLGQN